MGRTLYKFEVAIGGGIPLQSMLQPIVHGGDEVTSVAAVFSASMSYVLRRMENVGQNGEKVRPHGHLGQCANG